MKVQIESRDTVAEQLAEVLDIGELLCLSQNFDGTNPVVWFFESESLKHRESLLACAHTILENVQDANFFMNKEAIWNPGYNLVYREQVEFLTNPDACVRLVIKPKSGHVIELEITAYGSIRVECNFAPMKICKDTGAILTKSNPEYGNSL